MLAAILIGASIGILLAAAHDHIASLLRSAFERRRKARERQKDCERKIRVRAFCRTNNASYDAVTDMFVSRDGRKIPFELSGL